jgi:hypothetical protein
VRPASVGALSLRSGGVDSWAAAWLQAAGALLIAIGLGSRDPNAATAVAALACLLAGVAIVGPPGVLVKHLGRHSVVTVLLAGLVVVTLANVVMPPLGDARHLAALVLASAVGALSLVLRGRLAIALLVTAVLAQFVLACWMIATLGAPDGDVHMFQQHGLAALVSGENPYSLRYPNTADPGSEFYAPELQIGDRLAFGFPYPPLSLVMALPGYLVAGDYRYGAAASLAFGALLIAALRPGAIASGTALILAFSPLTFRILYYGWTEPFVVLWLVAGAFAASRLAIGTPLALGLLVAAKQYTLPVLVLAPLLLADVRRRIGWRRMVGVALLVAAITAAPFLIWHPRDFLFDVVAVQAIQPLRTDSASVLGVLARMGIPVPGAWITFAMAGLALLLIAWRAPRTTAGYAGAVAFVFLVFFLFSKQAFGNYFLFPLGALACAVAATKVAFDE